MSRVTLIRPATKGTPATAEVKIEGKPYHAAKPATDADPGEVQVNMSVAEAQAITRVLGRLCSAGGISPTSGVWNKLDDLLPRRDNPFELVQGKIVERVNMAPYVSNPYLILK